MSLQCGENEQIIILLPIRNHPYGQFISPTWKSQSLLCAHTLVWHSLLPCNGSPYSCNEPHTILIGFVVFSNTEVILKDLPFWRTLKSMSLVIGKQFKTKKKRKKHDVKVLHKNSTAYQSHLVSGTWWIMCPWTRKHPSGLTLHSLIPLGGYVNWLT